jgi:hypothetical protein
VSSSSRILLESSDLVLIAFLKIILLDDDWMFLKKQP